MDKREMILARLFAILQSVPNVEHCFRNRAELPDEKRPAIILLDGDETATKQRNDQPSVNAAPNLINVAPEIYVSLKGQKPDNKTVGQDVNTWRRKIIKLILTDAMLVDLVGPNGTITYNGCVTDLRKGHAMNGELGLDFTFAYVLRVSDL